MSSEALSKILREKMIQVLEGAAFMFVEDEAAPLPAPADGVEVQLSFAGVRRGTFYLSMSVEDSNRLATGMLGTQLVEATDENGAASAEFLNMLANWVLDAWWGSEAHYRLGIPSVQSKLLEQCLVWSLPHEQRIIMRTDANCTILCGIALARNQDEEAPNCGVPASLRTNTE